ncbi:MAG: prepilin-type N-terminal cleavage/methylation domain-containing protein [Planctomycetes bacterium]|nr:prepilin-type N-terminal cleavage/methylation domain-containing protein [Planctomycetota bacterium]
MSARRVAVPGAPRRRARNRRSGFSLIELLIVVMIFAVMVVVGIQVNEMLGPESELAATTDRIATSIADARADAIVCGRIVLFEFSLGETAGTKQYFRSIREALPGREDEVDEDQFLLTVSDWQALPDSVRFDAVVIGEQEPYTSGLVSLPIRPDGTMPSFLVRLWAPELDPELQRLAGWSAVQVAGLLGEARVFNRYVEPEFLREDSFQ